MNRERVGGGGQFLLLWHHRHPVGKGEEGDCQKQAPISVRLQDADKLAVMVGLLGSTFS